MRNQAKAQLIHFVQIGNQEIGYISIAELARDVPFEVQRIFWTYDTPTGVLRGKHGHKETEIVLVAVK
ncbi:MAG: WxcM-like domain-containing protein, partial [Saprospiraceae bacterium]